MNSDEIDMSLDLYYTEGYVLTNNDVDGMKQTLCCIDNGMFDRLFEFIDKDEFDYFKDIVEQHRYIINRKNKKGKYLLHEAVRQNRLEFATFLLFNKAETDLKDSSGFCAQHYGALADQPMMIDVLVLFNSDLNVKDNNGNTPLHHAITNLNYSSVEKLIEHKANPLIKNNDDNAPIDFCCLNKKIMTLLGEYITEYAK